MVDSFIMQRFILKYVPAVFGAVILSSVTLFGQQKDTTLKEIVVVERLTHSASKASAPVQRMNHNEIEKLGIQELYEA
ncbi:MAG: hypothetical protein RR770_06420, partial [Bacteroidales bacterium]